MTPFVRAALLCLLSLPAFLTPAAQAQSIRSQQSGPWNDSGTWSGGVIPDSSSRVVISAGDTVLFPANSRYYACTDLLVDSAAALVLNTSFFSVLDSTVLLGSLTDVSSTGTNRFTGPVVLQGKGKWNTSLIGTASRLILEGGMRHDGDSVVFNRCTFLGTDPVLSGSKEFILNSQLLIGPGVTLYNRNTAGIRCLGALQGSDSLSTFVNETTLLIRSTSAVMQTGRVDFSPEGNTVIYQGNSNSTVRAGTYFNLRLLAADTTSITPTRNLGGTLDVLGSLELAPLTRVQVRDARLTALGSVRLAGIVVDTDTAGFMRFGDVNISGALFDGTGDSRGKMLVQGKLRVSTANAEFREIDLVMEDSVLITPGRTLTFNGSSGLKAFGPLLLRPQARIVITGVGGQYEFRKPVRLGAVIQLISEVPYIFKDSVFILPGGNLDGRAAAAIYASEKALINNGVCRLSGSQTYLSGLLAGDSSMSVFSPVTIPAGRTLTNQLGKGLFLYNRLNGENESASFVNHTLLEYSPEATVEAPMGRGTFDVCSVPGNAVIFGSELKNQNIPGGCYQHVSFRNAAPKYLVDGDVEIRGNLDVSSTIVKEPTALTISRMILSGTQDQVISGNGEGVLETLIIRKDSGSLQVNDNFAVTEVLVLENGVIDANPGVILLGGSASLLETNLTSYVRGRVATQRRINAGSSNTFGGLGIRVRAEGDQPLGQTLVIRTTGSAREPGQIERSYEVIPTNTTNVNATIEFLYADRDISGALEDDLAPEASIANGEYTPFELFIAQPDTNLIRIEEVTQFGIFTARAQRRMPVLVYPSPMLGETVTVSYVLEQAAPAEIVIFDRMGRTITRHETEGQPGKNEVRFTGMKLRAGIYFVRVKAGKRKGNQTFIKLTE
ncbi:MAG: T9SS type A sorting domain-containing protein [Bacteroidia bacterium]|nr:T9SS type A sorting domain-containing protein [Bacteroidia bacterium]